MLNKNDFPGKALVISIIGLAFAASPSWAALTAPALELVSGGTTLIIDATGTCYSSLSPLTTTTCSGSVSVSTAGQIVFTGTVGTFSGIVTGRTTPAITAPSIDLGILGSGTGTLTASWTETGFTVGESPGTMSIVGAAAAAATVTYTSYVDTTNAAFGTGTLVGTVPATATGNQKVTGPGPSKSPFSMTNVEVITFAAGSQSFSNDFSFNVAPEAPLALACASATTGTVGVAYSGTLVASGGVSPYTYSILSGSISPLLLAASTGVISGTPTASGTLSFTAQVTDSSGTTYNTASTACSIVVSPASSTTGGSGGTTTTPLKITCPTSSATVGTYYSSTPAASGGTPPYKYSVAFGSLPDGLTLNTSTGLISGTPTTASETGAFKIEVTDSRGNTAYTSCSGTCSNGVTVTYGGTQPQSGWGQKGTWAGYTSNGLPINCYGFTTSGAPTNLYSNNWQGNSVLGLSNWSNSNQIDTGHFVQFDISSHINSGATAGSIAVSTWDWNSTYDVYGSNTLGSLGTLLASQLSADSSSRNIPNCTKYKYICVKAHSGNCVISSLQFSYPCACAIDVSQAQSWGWGSSWGSISNWSFSGFGQFGGGQNGWGEGGNPGQCGW